MASLWVESLGRSFDGVLDLLAGAVRDCPDELWATSMWPVPAGGREIGWVDPAITDPEERLTLAQRHSTPWAVAWHALETLDYDLTGELDAWKPPPPFADVGGWQISTLPAPWTRSEILGYVEYCRHRVQATLDGMTDARAAALLPPAHRYHDRPHAWIITDLLGHTAEHGSQIRQFITAAGAMPDGRRSPAS